jgi:ferritin
MTMMEKVIAMLKRTQYIDEPMRTMLIEQYRKELENSRLYGYIAYILKINGWENIGGKFKTQANEEVSHSEIIKDFLNDMNIFDFKMEALYEVGEDTKEFDLDFNNGSGSINILKIAEFFLQREEATTQSINKILQESKQSNDIYGGVTEHFLLNLIEKQRAELEEANTFLDIVEDFNGDTAQLRILDIHFEDVMGG